MEKTITSPKKLQVSWNSEKGQSVQIISRANAIDRNLQTLIPISTVHHLIWVQKSAPTSDSDYKCRMGVTSSSWSVQSADTHATYLTPAAAWHWRTPPSNWHLLSRRPCTIFRSVLAQDGSLTQCLQKTSAGPLGWTLATMEGFLPYHIVCIRVHRICCVLLGIWTATN